MLDDEEEMKNLSALVSPLPGQSLKSPGGFSQNTVGTKVTKVPTQHDYLGTIKKKIGRGEQNAKVFNRFG